MENQGRWKQRPACRIINQVLKMNFWRSRTGHAAQGQVYATQGMQPRLSICRAGIGHSDIYSECLSRTRAWCKIPGVSGPQSQLFCKIGTGGAQCKPPGRKPGTQHEFRDRLTSRRFARNASAPEGWPERANKGCRERANKGGPERANKEGPAQLANKAGHSSSREMNGLRLLAHGERRGRKLKEK